MIKYTSYYDRVFTCLHNLSLVAARGAIGREGCEISSLVEHMGLSPWLFL